MTTNTIFCFNKPFEITANDNQTINNKFCLCISFIKYYFETININDFVKTCVYAFIKLMTGIVITMFIIIYSILNSLIYVYSCRKKACYVKKCDSYKFFNDKYNCFHKELNVYDYFILDLTTIVLFSLFMFFLTSFIKFVLPYLVLHIKKLFLTIPKIKKQYYKSVPQEEKNDDEEFIQI